MSDASGRHYPKRIRLERRLYETSLQCVAITVTCRDRRHCFENSEFTRSCRDSLEFSSARYGIDVLVFCFMPDHLHLLVQRQLDGVNVIDFVQRYKSFTAKLAWDHGFDGKIWQPRFYDHILREHEDPMKHIRYIIENPVRAGIVSTWIEYPHTGSLVFDLAEFDW